MPLKRVLRGYHWLFFVATSAANCPVSTIKSNSLSALYWERLAAVPSVRPDVSIIHAQRADRQGNVLVEGIVGVQKEAVLAAKHSIVTVEEIVDDLGATPMPA